MVRILKKEVLSEKRYPLLEVQFERQMSSGDWVKDQREVYDHGDAVAALLYNVEEGTVVLTSQFRLPVFLHEGGSGILVEATAGLMEKGEAPEETMKREITEETGFEISALEKVYEGYSSAGFSTERLHLFLGSCKKGDRKSEGGGLKDEGESITVLEIPYGKALEKLDRGEIRDLKTIVLLQCLRLRGLMQP